MLSFAAFILVVLSLIFLSHKNNVGWYLSIAASILWAVVAVQNHLIMLFVQQIVLVGIALNGLYKWRTG